MTSIDPLETALGGLLQRPGDEKYDAATQPRNRTAQESPAAVVMAASADDVRLAVRTAVDVGLRVAVQATGHGAAGAMADDVLLIDSTQLDTIAIDSMARTARVGAGVTWATLNAEAERHGLIGLAGTAPDVSVVGYIVFGGIGWLTRPHGMASASLRRVEFVDGMGRSQVADVDHPDALWAFRGAGGVGVATLIEIGLVDIGDLWAGYRLWPIEQAEAVVAAWVAAVEGADETLTSAIGFLSAPDAPTVPAQLRGRRVVHISAASTSGAAGFAPLENALSPVPDPAIDTVGPCDARRLSGIHLDPDSPVPAVGEGRWLTAGAGAHALPILASHGLDDDAPLSEIEIRHTSTAVGADTPGALTGVPGSFLLHAVGPAPEPDDHPAVEEALGVVRASAEPVDSGRASTSFRDGQTSAADVLLPDARERLAAIRRRLDPQRSIWYPRPI